MGLGKTISNMIGGRSNKGRYSKKKRVTKNTRKSKRNTRQKRRRRYRGSRKRTDSSFLKKYGGAAANSNAEWWNGQPKFTCKGIKESDTTLCDKRNAYVLAVDEGHARLYCEGINEVPAYIVGDDNFINSLTPNTEIPQQCNLKIETS